MPCNLNFDSQYPLTHESAKAMVVGQHAASRELDQRCREALKATCGDKMAALAMLLADGGPFKAPVMIRAAQARRAAA
jgi:hypothetical protein